MAQLDRALDLLEFLAQRRSVGVGEICAELKLPRPTAHRLLNALQERGYVRHDPRTHLYGTGIATQLLARPSTMSTLLDVGEAALTRLRDETRETTNLAVLNGTRIVYAATLDGILLPRMAAFVGQDVSPHATALGKAILAAIPEDERGAVIGPAPFHRYTPNTRTTPDEIAAELELVASEGYAVDDEESNVGAVCLASVIIDDGRPVGGISVSSVTSRLSEGQRSELGELVRRTCQEITRMLAADSPEVTR